MWKTLHQNELFLMLLCQALDERFGDIQLSEVFKSGLRNLCRKEGESLTALAQDINCLVQHAYPEVG